MKAQSVMTLSRLRLATLLPIGQHYISLTAESVGPSSYVLPRVLENQKILNLHAD